MNYKYPLLFDYIRIKKAVEKTRMPLNGYLKCEQTACEF